MVSYNKRDNNWRAKRRRNGEHYFLGCYKTKQEAEEKEREFDKKYPPNILKRPNSKGLSQYRCTGNRNGKTYHLGYFKTYEELHLMHIAFDAAFPKENSEPIDEEVFTVWRRETYMRIAAINE